MTVEPHRDAAAANEHTFLFADLAGYSALTEAHGDEHAADVAAEFVQEARALLGVYEAEEVKAIGDALLIRTGEVSSAIDLARRLVCEIGARDRALGIRVGMHSGTAVERDGDWFGSAVNVAARVADAAKSGEVILTEASRRGAGSEVELRPRGQRRFKNITEPVELFALVLDEHLPTGRVLDPVCRMSLDPDGSNHRFEYQSVTYTFCSERCRETFRRKPSAYTRARASQRDHLLVSEDARARAARELGAAFKRGRLDSDELESRMGHVWSARTRADLRALTHDLPSSRRRGSWFRVLWPPRLFRRLRRRA